MLRTLRSVCNAKWFLTSVLRVSADVLCPPQRREDNDRNEIENESDGNGKDQTSTIGRTHARRRKNEEKEKDRERYAEIRA